MKFVDVQQYEAMALHKETIDALLFKIPEVTAIGIGYKTIGDVETDEMSIIVSVKRKGSFAPAHLIPPLIEGCKTDVIENEVTLSPPLSKTELSTVEGLIGEDTRRYNPLQPGCSITIPVENGLVSQGSLGPAVILTMPDAREFYLSCWHVMCVTDDWKKRSREVYQPWGFFTADDKISSVIEGNIGEIQRSKQIYFIDAAYCYVDPRVRGIGKKIPLIGPITGYILQNNMTTLLNKSVAKYGARTELTQGIVTDVRYSWKNTADPKGTTFLNQILVQPTDPYKVFNEQGDSGSPVVTKGNGRSINDGVAAGIVMGKNTKLQTGVINPMWMILGALGLQLLVEPPEHENG